MGKFYGAIGYATHVETTPGVWQERIIERNYMGDVERSQSKWRDGENQNSNIVLDNRFSIVADPFAYEQAHKIRYIQVLGVKWTVKSVEVRRPRLIIAVGEVYNEQKTST